MANQFRYRDFMEGLVKSLEQLSEPKVTMFPKAMIQTQQTEFVLDIGEILDASKSRFTIFPSGEIRMPEQIGNFAVTKLGQNKYRFTLIGAVKQTKIQFGEDRQWKI